MAEPHAIAALVRPAAASPRENTADPAERLGFPGSMEHIDCSKEQAMSRSGTSTQALPAAAAKRRPEGLSYLAVYRASPLERIRMIKHGIRATEAKRIIAELALGQGAALKALNLSPATVNKKARQDETLSPGESERVIGFARLVGQLEAVVQESGDPEGFDAAAWMSRWLNDPVPALGGARPIDLMDTMEGQALVSTTLAQLQSGAYA
jgi:putative toxin-antitoxin system antitoxin component (TIGR02293 family)